MKQPAEAARDNARDIPRALDADALTLTAYCFPKIGQLVFHHVVDCLASGIDVVTDLLHDIVDRNAVNQLSPAIHCVAEATFGARSSPASALHRAVACPPRSFRSAPASPLRPFQTGQSGQCRTPTGVANQRTDWTTARGPASQQQRDTRSDSSADQRGGEQIVLLLALLVEFTLWV